MKPNVIGLASLLLAENVTKTLMFATISAIFANEVANNMNRRDFLILSAGVALSGCDFFGGANKANSDKNFDLLSRQMVIMVKKSLIIRKTTAFLLARLMNLAKTITSIFASLMAILCMMIKNTFNPQKNS